MVLMVDNAYLRATLAADSASGDRPRQPLRHVCCRDPAWLLAAISVVQLLMLLWPLADSPLCVVLLCCLCPAEKGAPCEATETRGRAGVEGASPSALAAALKGWDGESGAVTDTERPLTGPVRTAPVPDDHVPVRLVRLPVRSWATAGVAVSRLAAVAAAAARASVVRDRRVRRGGEEDDDEGMVYMVTMLLLLLCRLSLIEGLTEGKREGQPRERISLSLGRFPPSLHRLGPSLFGLGPASSERERRGPQGQQHRGHRDK